MAVFEADIILQQRARKILDNRIPGLITRVRAYTSNPVVFCVLSFDDLGEL